MYGKYSMLYYGIVRMLQTVRAIMLLTVQYKMLRKTIEPTHLNTRTHNAHDLLLIRSRQWRVRQWNIMFRLIVARCYELCVWFSIN